MAETVIKPFKVYAIYDGKNKNFGQIEITSEEQEEKLQNEGYGIFWTVNEYKGARKAENVTKINYWFCDLDSKIAGSKDNMLKDIANLRIRPTHIIETKNGFHCYWRAKNATLENWKRIEKGIVKKLNADPARTDPNGLLRKVYTAHLKDWEENKNNPKYIPFCIRYLFDSFDFIDFNTGKHLEDRTNKTYYEKEMLNYFAKEEKKPIPPPPINTNLSYQTDNNIFLDDTKWDKIFDLKTWGEGNRNNNFARIILWMKDKGLLYDEIKYIVYSINRNRIYPPLPDRELESILRGKGIR